MKNGSRQQEETGSDWLTVQQVSRLLHVHPNTIRKWSKQGLLQCWRVGPRGDRRFKPEDVHRMIQDDQGESKDRSPSDYDEGVDAKEKD